MLWLLAIGYFAVSILLLVAFIKILKGIFTELRKF